jgi:hypothetical protein
MNEGRTPDLPQPVYLLRLSSLPSSVPAVVRLRRLLKGLRRAYSFRCVGLEEIGGPEGARGRPAKAPDEAQDAPQVPGPPGDH